MDKKLELALESVLYLEMLNEKFILPEVEGNIKVLRKLQGLARKMRQGVVVKKPTAVQAKKAGSHWDRISGLLTTLEKEKDPIKKQKIEETIYKLQHRRK